MNYPYDIITEFSRNKSGETKTFSIAACFVPQNDESPLKFFGTMSRFSATIIQNKAAASLNLHTSDLAALKSVTEYAIKEYYDRKFKGHIDEENLSPAYMTRFQFGALKGKTPVDVLKENGENGRKMLNDQYVFLKSQLAKFPNNKDLMDAIMDAANLDPAELTDKASFVPVFTLMEIGCRGNIRKKRASDGFCPCYDGKITFDLSRNLPVTIQIRNYHAPISVKSDGTQNVLLSDMDKNSVINNSFSMSAECWLKCLKEMEDIVIVYKTIHAGEAFRAADKAFSDNRESAKITQMRKAG